MRGAALAAVCALAATPAVSAQPSAARMADARPTCGTLLTDAEVESAVGRRGPTSAVHESAPGSSQCSWTWADTESTLTVSYSDARAIEAMRDVTKCCPQPATPAVGQFFDHTVRVAVDLGADPPASLTGMGERAALFFEEGFLKLVVQRRDGVAQIVGANITREQLIAVGKALAAP